MISFLECDLRSQIALSHIKSLCLTIIQQSGEVNYDKVNCSKIVKHCRKILEEVFVDERK